MKWAFRHIHEHYSPQNISTIKYLFMKNAYKTDNFQENLSRPGIIHTRARYRAAAGRLRNTGLHYEGPSATTKADKQALEINQWATNPFSTVTPVFFHNRRDVQQTTDPEVLTQQLTSDSFKQIS